MIKKVLFTIVTIVLIASCSETSENSMMLTGNVKGLKKGTLYLEKIEDSTLITVDSIALKGDGNFSFSYELESPEIFYLHLDKADNNDINDRLTFFGEKGEVYIETVWNSFDSKAEIVGSKTHKEFDECRQILTKFSIRELELAQQISLPQYNDNTTALDSLVKLSNKNVLRRYLYVLNFALTNPDSYASPYLALTEASDANPKYLDSIQKALSPNVANSKYGKALKKYLEVKETVN
ncbi:DUF4369 domain-containing protein [uncultured Croceitalea sp.]|uniref:DUF4369 domain-containing protein n=1 Tax=uncultured Croceitalea sp. TaxID=1798908 RepID=UPI0033063401